MPWSGHFREIILLPWKNAFAAIFAPEKRTKFFLIEHRTGRSDFRPIQSRGKEEISPFWFRSRTGVLNADSPSLPTGSFVLLRRPREFQAMIVTPLRRM